MPKVIIFSTTFPAYHPMAGRGTLFLTQFINSLKQWPQENNELVFDEDLALVARIINNLKLNDTHYSKHHTIRQGQRFKVGEYFSPRIWSGKPYASKQITICNPVRIEQIYNIHFDGKEFYINGVLCAFTTLIRLASNDGFLPQNKNLLQAFQDWFTKPFTGQIICWNKDIKY